MLANCEAFRLDFEVFNTNNPTMPRVVLENVTKDFRGADGNTIRAVEDLSLTIEENELLALVGPSGCGKSTTLRLIAGLETADSGTVLLDGKAANGVPPAGRDVAMVFQNHALFPHMTARENIAFGLKLRGVHRDEIAGRVSEMATLLHITELLDRRPAALSGGERQRVALGRALIRRPRVLLLDEPLSQLDALLRARLREEILRIRRELGVAMLLVTHDLAEALALGNRVAVMNRGRIEQIGTPEEIRNRPANAFILEFLGTILGVT